MKGTYLTHFSKFYILTAFLDAIFNTGAILCFAEVANTIVCYKLRLKQTLWYIDSKTNKIEEHISYKKICTFCCFCRVGLDV